MSEVTLPAPVDAKHIADWPDDAPPGAFTISVDSDGKPSSMIYCCPCGCGNQGSLTLRPTTRQGASWEWNGNLESPTLSPSVHHVGHWHGWLKEGKWVQA